MIIANIPTICPPFSEVTVLPVRPVLELKGAEVTVTCRVESSHDVIALHLVHDTSQFNVEGEHFFCGEHLYT